MASLHLLILPMLEFLRNQFWGQHLFLVFINGIYADDTTIYSILGKSALFVKLESAGELEFCGVLWNEVTDAL